MLADLHPLDKASLVLARAYFPDPVIILLGSKISGKIGFVCS
jgi:hypothetical protein